MQNLSAVTDRELQKGREAAEFLMELRTLYQALDTELYLKLSSWHADVIAMQEQRAAGDREVNKGREAKKTKKASGEGGAQTRM